MMAGKSGIFAASGALVSCIALVAVAGSWVKAGFDGSAVNPAIAKVWSPATLGKSALVKTGDENFWLSGLNAGLNSAINSGTSIGPSLVASPSDAAAHAVITQKVVVGDRMTLSLNAGTPQIFEIVDVKPIDAGVVPVSSVPTPVGLVIVTGKLVDAAPGAAHSVVRFVVEDTPAAAPRAAPETRNKAL
jgi:hypothetical protein